MRKKGRPNSNTKKPEYLLKTDNTITRNRIVANALSELINVNLVINKKTLYGFDSFFFGVMISKQSQPQVQ